MNQQISTASPLVAEVARRFSEPAWLKEQREQAYERFAEMPAPKLEKTDLRKRSFEIGPFPALTEGGSAQARALIGQLTEQGKSVLYVRDGVVVQTSVSDGLERQGVVFADLHQALETHEAVVKKHYGTVVTVEESKGTALNAAVWHSGPFLYVPRGVAATESFVFVHETSKAGHGAAPRGLIVAEEGAQCAFTEIFLTDGELESGCVHTDVLEVVVGSDAEVTVGTVSSYRKGPTNLSTRRAKVDKDGRMHWVFTDLGDGFTVALVESDLVGSGSNATFQGAAVGGGRQHLDLTASMLHKGRYSESELELRGALKGKANSVYRTSTHIFRHAVGAGSEQNDRMLMLDKTARADAIPMLLIDENDVQRCGHAASVGRIDEGQIYYLQSRGIPANVARRMIVWGHMEPTVDALPEEVTREYVRERMYEELG